MFVGSVTGSLRKDSSIDIFGRSNIKESAIELIKNGLVEEEKDKEYIDNDTLTEKNIDDFLDKVLIVVDNDKKPSEYVKAIIKNHPNIIPEEKILDAIFNEIRDKQAGKKNASSVENIVIETTDEALNYGRHLTNNEIRLMTLQRIINSNPLGKGIPASFVNIYNTWPPENQREMLEDCQRALCRALFNKNAADGFWRLFENTYRLIVEKPNDSVQNLFTMIRSIPDCVSRCPDFDVLSLKYFIAVVKDGIQG